MQYQLLSVSSALVLGLAACGGDAIDPDVNNSEGGGGTAGGGTAGTAGTTSQPPSGAGTGGKPSSGGGSGGEVVAPEPGGWEPLLGHDWSLEPGTEAYFCVVARVPYNMTVRGFRQLSIQGTHHTVLAYANGGAEGVSRCSALDTGRNMLYGSGLGTQALEFPEGVGITLNKGELLHLNLHLYNTKATTLTGRSGIEVLTVDPADIEHEAEALLHGPLFELQVPPGGSTATETCRANKPWTVFAVFPHMHQLGTHMKVVAELAAGEQVLHDADYSFDDQAYTKLSPEVRFEAGDRLRVECTYENPTGETRVFGESSNDEMCFTGIYRYPKSPGGGCGVF
jgi:hypothetical protein